MAKIRITKEFNFEMAHALWDYDGACSNIHGHSYKLFVTLKGNILHDNKSPKNGMVADFGDIKKLVKSEIVNDFDHSLIISNQADIECMSATKQMFNKVLIMDFQPTCENLLVFFADKLIRKLPQHLKLYSLKLRETETSFAEWFAEDNE